MISNNNIRLRNKRLSDARNDYGWRTDPLLAELDAAAVMDISFSRYLSDFTFELCYPSLNRHEFAVETPEGRHIGNCVYYNINESDGEAEIGIMLGDRSYWGKGYGSDVVNTLLDHIFNHTSLKRIYLNTLDWNTRAQKCFRKCAFSECGQLKRDGHTFLVMEIKREEWLSKDKEVEEDSNVRKTTFPSNALKP